MRDYDIAPGVAAAIESFKLPEKLVDPFSRLRHA
jgi:hypothetical protein